MLLLSIPFAAGLFGLVAALIIYSAAPNAQVDRLILITAGALSAATSCASVAFGAAIYRRWSVHRNGAPDHTMSVDPH